MENVKKEYQNIDNLTFNQKFLGYFSEKIKYFIKKITNYFSI